MFKFDSAKIPSAKAVEEISRMVLSQISFIFLVGSSSVIYTYLVGYNDTILRFLSVKKF